ncbi:MAG TPA: glucosamine-6-phosphate deaminase [Opitutus sp.]|nr:glucosamine-6-phosphate deaminase [Opitutus sp.]
MSAGAAAAALGAARIRAALAARGEANISLATGTSQFDMLNALVEEPDIAWNRVTAFHLDEYVGLPFKHPASLRAYLWQRFHRRLPRPPRAMHYLSGEGDPEAECERVGALLERHPIDVCFAGIGENAHLAFNDPPADFHTRKPYLIVKLDEICRRQQYREGWFRTPTAVPSRAISMSIAQVMAARTIVVTAPDDRKADAVQRALEGPVTNAVPSSVLQRHADAHVFLDEAAAAKLTRLFEANTVSLPCPLPTSPASGRSPATRHPRKNGRSRGKSARSPQPASTASRHG